MYPLGSQKYGGQGKEIMDSYSPPFVKMNFQPEQHQLSKFDLPATGVKDKDESKKNGFFHDLKNLTLRLKQTIKD